MRKCVRVRDEREEGRGREGGREEEEEEEEEDEEGLLASNE